MTMDDREDDQALDTLFEAGRGARAKPTPEFMARLVADADAEMVTVPVAVPAPQGRGFGWLRGLFAASGLSGAATLGLWFGFAMPEAYDTLSLTSDDTIALSSFLPSADMGGVFDE